MQNLMLCGVLWWISDDLLSSSLYCCVNAIAAPVATEEVVIAVQETAIVNSSALETAMTIEAASDDNAPNINPITPPFVAVLKAFLRNSIFIRNVL